MQKSCKIKYLNDCLRFQIVTIPLLKLHLELRKRIQPIWEINFHFLVRILPGYEQPIKVVKQGTPIRQNFIENYT